MSHSHVLLKSTEKIDLAERRRFREHSGSILEGSRRDETIGLKRRLGNPKKHWNGFRRFTTLFGDSPIFFVEFKSVDLITPEQLGITRFGDFHFPQHLANNDLDMFIINLNALEAVHLLHLVYQVLLQILRSADIQDFMRYNATFSELRTFLHEIALEYDDGFIERDKVLFFLAAGCVAQDKPPLSANSTAKLDQTIDLRDLSRIFRTTSLEEFGNSWQTTGDIFCFCDLSRSLSEKRAGRNLVPVLNHDVCTGRNCVTRDFLFAIIQDDDLRMQIFLVLNNNRPHDAGRFVDLSLNGNTRNHVAKFDSTGFLCQDRNIVRIPFDKRLTLLHLSAVADRDY